MSSKTFTTQETMTNALTAREWALKQLGDEKAVAKHFVAVSTNAQEVAKFGIDTENMFGFWDWVGGRYSMDSAIGLSTMIAIGPENFRAMLAGLPHDGRTFSHSTVRQESACAPGTTRRVVQQLLWIADSSGAAVTTLHSETVSAYLQQLTMESNGKSTTLEGGRVDYQTGGDLLG